MVIAIFADLYYCAWCGWALLAYTLVTLCRRTVRGIQRMPVWPVSFRIPVMWQYPFALGAFALSFLARYLLDAWLGSDRGLILFVPAVAVTTFAAGLGSGIFSAVLSGVAIWYCFLPPYYSFELDQEGVVALASYVLVAALTIGLIHSLGVLIDRLEEAKNRQQLLVSELQHRSQNLFTVIQSIASRSLVDGQSLSAAKEVFTSRLHALARAHRMLAETAWTGAPLVQILKEELAPVSNSVTVNGCDIIINTPAAQHFAMIVHELATNALKYGALSVPDGRIRIEGSTEQINGAALFRFLWSEHGGPPVLVPSRKGFGTAILIDAAKQVAQDVSVNYDPNGLRYELQVPLRTIQASPSPRAEHGMGSVREALG
jgi:two-component sensor histidine kinase